MSFAERMLVFIALAGWKAFAGCIAVFSALAGWKAFAGCMAPATVWLAVASLAAAAELTWAFEVDFAELLIKDFLVTAMFFSPAF